MLSTVKSTRQTRAFGQQSVLSGSSANPFTWVGKLGYYRQPDPSDYWIRARIMKPGIGRWASKDPLVGDPSRYLYVWNRTYSAVDPSGWDGGLALVILTSFQAAEALCTTVRAAKVFDDEMAKNVACSACWDAFDMDNLNNETAWCADGRKVCVKEVCWWTRICEDKKETYYEYSTLCRYVNTAAKMFVLWRKKKWRWWPPGRRYIDYWEFCPVNAGRSRKFPEPPGDHSWSRCPHPGRECCCED